MNVRESGSKLTFSTDASRLNSKTNFRSNKTGVKILNKSSRKESNPTSLACKSVGSSSFITKSSNSKSSSSKSSSIKISSLKSSSTKISDTNSSSAKSSSTKNKRKASNTSLKSDTTSSMTKEDFSRVRKKTNKDKRLKEKGQQVQAKQESDSESNDQPSLQQSDSIQNTLASNKQFDSTHKMHSTSSVSSSQPNQDGWYSKEIQNMMHGFGDSPHPNLESVRLVEQIVHQQVTCLLRLACDVAIQRQSKQIGLEDFLFLLRKDKVKLCRLLRHFNLKDMRNRMSSEQWTACEDQASSVLDESGALDAGCTLDFDEEELLNALISEQKTNQTQDSFYTAAKQTTQQPSNQATSKATTFPKPAKRLQLCLDFLASIDQTGELDRYLQEDHFFDELKHNRMLRIERITRSMTEKEYLNFYTARQTSFANRLQPNKFRDWLYNVPYNQLDTNDWPIKPNALAIEILQYFAYETVATLVDLALLVKQDQQRRSTDPVSRLISMNSHTNAFPLLNSNGNLSFASTTTNQMASNYTSPSNGKQANLTNLLNPTTFSNCSSLGTFSAMNTSNQTSIASTNLTSGLTSANRTQQTINKDHQPTILPSPFIFSSANVRTQVDCPFFSIKPQEIREVIRRYMNNPRGTLSSVLLFGIEQWNQPNIARSKVICL